MTRENDRPTGSPAIDDDALGALIRSVSDDWRMPPQRLDQPTWRDRVGGRGSRRSRGWFPRLAGPAVAAIVATVVVAFVAVWLTTPRVNQGIVAASPSSSATAPASAPTRSSSPRPSGPGLPGPIVSGELPDPAKVMVRAGDTYRVADLSTGTLGTSAIDSRSGLAVLVADQTGWTCICDLSASRASPPDTLALSLVSVTIDGAPRATVPLRTVHGALDPAASRDSQPQIVDAGAIGSPDGRYAFVGWSARQGSAGWTAGLDVVNLVDQKLLTSTPLTLVEPAGAGGRPTTRTAPRMTLSPSGDAVLIASSWYVQDDASATPPAGTDHWVASFDGRTLGSPIPAGSIVAAQCAESSGGLIDGSRYYVVCSTPEGGLMVDRDFIDGTPVDPTQIPQATGGLDEAGLVVRHGDQLFIWDPLATRLTRFDLKTGVVDSTTGTALAPGNSAGDVLAALGREVGRWLAPPVAAKVLLQPGLVISPDGKRIYAIGIDLTGSGAIGRQGIFVFDAGSLAQIEHSATTFGFDSLAISPDGRFLYAAAGFGIDAATGTLVPDRASITVYDTTNDTVRLIAGDLGGTPLQFPGPIAR